MTKFEYIHRYFTSTTLSDEILNMLGKQGWELVSATVYLQVNGTEVFHLFFKRPIYKHGTE